MVVRRRPKLAILVNGDSGGALGIRARSFADRLRDEFSSVIACRHTNKILAILGFFLQLLRERPDLVYVVDAGYSGVLASALYRLILRCRVVVDTGDAIFELARLTGSRGRMGLTLTRILEELSFRISDLVVVRSHPHQQLLLRRGIRAEVIPDGVDTVQFHVRDEPELRRSLAFEGFTVIGLVGSLIWSDRWQMCYGWDLVEAIGLLRDHPVKGLVIGDGSGLARLKTRCVELGIDDRVVFAGRVPYDSLPSWINLMDIGLSTQTNDAAGQVRTSGKLPLYLACGRFVLASEVGEAASVLPSRMLIPYRGTRDHRYPERLAAHVESLLHSPHLLRDRGASSGIAKRQFDYDVLAAKLRRILRQLLPEFASTSGTLVPTSTGITRP
jgi:glycosyltransferase involved in cell wall biosynthesis